MKKEAVEGISIPLRSVHERVVAATGVSKHISKEGKDICDGLSQSFTPPRKSKPQKCSKSTVDNFDVQVIRRTINEFHLEEKKHPTLSALLPIVREKTSFEGKISSLRILLGKIEFRWGKTNSDKSVLCERLDIRLKRIEFLRSINRFREEGHPIIYTDETYIHSSHTSPFQWKSDDKEGIKAPVLKGQQLIIVHGGGEMGFIPEALLIFKSGLKMGDYHREMNSGNYLKWVKNHLIPNLPLKSVVVIDNAPNHNVQLNRPPSSNAKKDTMKEWLDSRGQQYSSKETKIELYEKIRRHKEARIF
ncbi:hypothetical protein J437_LFUL014872 [Ladona fulva]|uniref:Tc1-like transposase DDE domain-containing protein n=1 Tax=Ladona fulva TaxID=123851 RepID=A0A8K0KI13_LADFU|nr:hypothetical protein J437_LFUL014872 [Ladona fulva]